MKACRLCGRTGLDLVLSIPRAPRNVQRLLTPEMVANDRPVVLDVYRCGFCDFVQLLDTLEDDYYDDYIMTASHSPQMQAYQADQARDFVERFSLRGLKVREMGCGDGNFLGHLRQAGAEVSGIEPSSRTRELALSNGFWVEGGYVSADRDLDGGPYDAFVTRQVLEHVPDVNDFLSGIRRNVKPGGFGLIEVPSLEKALEDRRFYDFFPDHLNYFSLRTLGLACSLNGFEVIDLYSGMYGEYNIALVRVAERPNLTEVQRCVGELSSDIRDFVQRHQEAGRTVIIWGAGAKGLSVLAASEVTGVDILVDSDANKRGLLTPLSHLAVEDPEIIRQWPDAAIIITAMAYRHEIEKTLVDDYAVRGEIAVLAERLQIVKEADREPAR